MEIIYKKETHSTNDDVRQLMRETQKASVVVSAEFQRNGRGQAGNHWESEKAQNLLFSIGVRPSFLPAIRQFLLLQVGAIAICQTLEEYADGFSIKWPNDIYYNDKKISGTLIESELCGTKISYSVIGCGLNVNQQTFVSDAPNPVSLWQITGRQTDCEELLQKILLRFSELYKRLEKGEEAIVRDLYKQRLYRRVGFYSYSDKNGQFKARFYDISPQGVLTLQTKDGELRNYAFKEVSYII